MPTRNLQAELKEQGLTLEDVVFVQRQMDKDASFFDAAENLLSLAICGYEVESLQNQCFPPRSREKALGILIRQAQ